MKRHILYGLFAGIFLLSFSVAYSDAAGLQTRYQATSIAGNQAPPNYGLRLDGFFDGNGKHEVTFAYDNVLFDVFTDGTARLYGTISVAEFNNTGGPGSYSSAWDMDVYFNAGSGSNQNYQYFSLDPNAETELINQADGTDYANLWQFMGDFQVGIGANEKNTNFGAAGWVNYEHTTSAGTIGDRDNHVESSDFLMDLTVVPEPVSSILFVAGAATLGFRRFYKMKKFI